MATPSSPIGFSDIYSEANGTPPVSPTSFKTLASSSYFEGPAGSSTIAFNAWGQARGLNGIWLVQAYGATPYNFGGYRNKSYFYDQSQYQSQWYIDNQCNSIPDYDFNWFFSFNDTSLTYNYCSSAGMIMGGNNTGTFDATNPTTPLIYGCNWYLQVDTNPQYPGDAYVDLIINGVNLMSNEPMANAGPYTEMFDYNTYGNSNIRVNSPTGATGSAVEIYFHQ
jgi:hypothetical protein